MHKKTVKMADYLEQSSYGHILHRIKSFLSGERILIMRIVGGYIE